MTAFFEHEDFLDKIDNTLYTTAAYFKWTRSFKYILNPVIVYTDSEKFADLIKSVRGDLSSRTLVYKIERNSSWAFQRRDKIAQLLKQLPKISPDYACAKLAKYDIISRAVKEDVYKTQYYMWLDIGYFKSRRSHSMFTLRKPENFQENKVAVSALYLEPPTDTVPEVLFQDNLEYIDTGVVFGKTIVLANLNEQVKKTVDYFISKGIIGTDSQIVYSMNSKETRMTIQPGVELQLYKPRYENDHYNLGYQMLFESK